MISRKNFLQLTGVSLLVRRLIAAVGPKRWGMAIDVARCAKAGNCQKCIDACHRAHNVPSIPDKAREVRWVWKDSFERAFRLEPNSYTKLASTPVMVLCNHCDNPPCVRVCPTQATWKRDDGIVAMDWHRCIGCRYCVAACPYGSRSFNWMDPRRYLTAQNPEFPTRSKGVVEKCTLCSERLAAGQLPACVEACPEKAIVFGNLADPGSEIRRLLGERYHTRRRPELGTHPEIYYIV